MTKMQEEIKKYGLTKVQEFVAALSVVLKQHYKGYSIKAILANVLVILSYCLCIKRIKVKELGEPAFVNLYLVNLAPSGVGKDQMLKDLKNSLLNRIDSLYDEIIKKHLQEYSGQENKKTQARIFIPKVTNATPEGLYADGKALKQAHCGCIFVQNSEIGNYLCNATQEQTLFINMLNDGYDGIIPAKSIKSEQREPDIEGIPIVALLHSDPTVFSKTNLKYVFNNMMETGLARRSILTFMPKREHYEIERDFNKAFEDETKYYDSLKRLGMMLFELFNKIEINTIYEITKENYATLHKYKAKIEELSRTENNSLLEREIESRLFKVLKVSAIYAALNHPNKKIIENLDIEQSIETIELLSTDFKKFLSFKPHYRDKYDSLFEFFKENIDKSFTKTDLINKHYQEFGTSRDKVRANFDEFIDTIKEIASNNSYFLDEQSINRNSGKSYTLRLAQPQSLSPEVKTLEELID